MPQSHPTLDQQRSNAAFSDSRSGPPVGVHDRKHLRGAYTNAAKRLWQLSDDWEVNLLMNVFGPERMGSIAAAFDPTARFRFGGQQVDTVRRKRVRATYSYELGVTAVDTVLVYTNYVIEPDFSVTIVPEYLVNTHIEDISEEYPQSVRNRTVSIEDSTDNLRAKGCLYSEMRETIPHSMVGLTPPPDTYNTVYKITVQEGDGRYTRTHHNVQFTYHGNGPIAPIVGNFGSEGDAESLEFNVRQWAAQHLEDVLPPCLSSYRTYNAFYQLGELTDLPMMISKTFESLDFLRNLSKSPKAASSRLDKTFSNAYLNEKFGYESMKQAIESLLKQPEKMAKRFNYLLKRNSKISSQRFTQKYKTPESMGSWLAPSVSYLVPVWTRYDLVDPVYDYKPSGELRCVVNGVVNFPPLAVPKFSDSTYRDMLGLYPRIVDLYNLIPWTWLGDWFSGVSKYLNLVEEVALDENLINVGFMTALYHCDIAVKGKIRIWQDYSITLNEFGDTISEVKSDPIDFEYDTSGSFDYRSRFSIDELPSVKSVLDKQGLLSEGQKLTLGALLTKFT